jgi:hypothetical protein
MSPEGLKYGRDRAKYRREHPEESPKPRKRRLPRNYRRTNRKAGR